MRYTVTITLTPANNFDYAPGYLRVHVGDEVNFECNRVFKVKFLYGSPFGVTTEFSSKGAPTAYAAVAAGTVSQLYHYVVTAIGPDGQPFVDAGCPTVDVG